MANRETVLSEAVKLREQGKTRAEIARKLGCSISFLKHHMPGLGLADAERRKMGMHAPGAARKGEKMRAEPGSPAWWAANTGKYEAAVLKWLAEEEKEKGYDGLC